MWEKFKAQLEAHPYLFGGVAIAVLFFIFYGGFGSSGGTGGTSAISAAEAQAIADSAQANAQLQLSSDQMNTAIQTSHDQVLMNGQDVAAAQAINESNNAAAVQAAQIAASANQYNDDTSVKLAGIQSAAQHDLENSILSSQNSAQDWITKLETSVKNYQLPNTISTAGFGGVFTPQTKAPSIPTSKPFLSLTNYEHSNGTSGAEGANGNGGGDSF